MNSAAIFSNISQTVELNATEKKFLESVLITRPFKRGEVIIKSGDTARYMMFVNSGYLMTYYTDKSGADHVIQFAAEGWWCGDISSLSNDPVALYSTTGLTDGEVLLLPRLAHEELLKNYISFEKYFRIFFHKAVLRHQLRFVENHSLSAEERYQGFINTYPTLEQFVSQKHIASFLGITPEFLSKVRKRLVQK